MLGLAKAPTSGRRGHLDLNAHLCLFWDIHTRGGVCLAPKWSRCTSSKRRLSLLACRSTCLNPGVRSAAGCFRQFCDVAEFTRACEAGCTSLRLPSVTSANVVRSRTASLAASASRNTAVNRHGPLTKHWLRSGWRHSTNFSGSSARTTVPTLIVSGGRAILRPPPLPRVLRRNPDFQSMDDDNQVVPRDSVAVCNVDDR